MAITVNSITNVAKGALDGGLVFDLDIDLDNSYPAGGYSLAGLVDEVGVTLTPVSVQPLGALASGRDFRLSADATAKLMVLDNAGVDIANTTDLSAMVGIKARFICI